MHGHTQVLYLHWWQFLCGVGIHPTSHPHCPRRIYFISSLEKSCMRYMEKNNIVRTRKRGKTWCRFSWSMRSGFHVWIKTLEKANYLLVDCDSKHAECSINRKVSCRPCRDNLLIFLNETLNNTVTQLTDTDDTNAPILPNTAKCNTCKYANIYEVKLNMLIFMKSSPEMFEF